MAEPGRAADLLTVVDAFGAPGLFPAAATTRHRHPRRDGRQHDAVPDTQRLTGGEVGERDVGEGELVAHRRVLGGRGADLHALRPPGGR